MQPIQIIDSEGNLKVENLDCLRSWSIPPEYKSIAILGSQNSGKSTLLNLLFGTSFEVLDGTITRRQVTTGIWAGYASSHLIFDVEGTDGKEDITFEIQSATLIFELAPIIILNLMMSDLDRWNGGNLNLLRTILNLQFSGSRLVIFALRDHVDTPISEIDRILRENLHRLNPNWNTYFQLAIICLPPKIISSLFQAGVEQFRNHLTAVSYFPTLAFEDVAASILPIWTMIRSNRELEIPLHRRLVAVNRCDTISRHLRTIVKEEIRTIDWNNFGSEMTALFARTIAKFNLESARHDSIVRTEARDKLVHFMLGVGMAIASEYLGSKMNSNLTLESFAAITNEIVPRLDFEFLEISNWKRGWADRWPGKMECLLARERLLAREAEQKLKELQTLEVEIESKFGRELNSFAFLDQPWITSAEGWNIIRIWLDRQIKFTLRSELEQLDEIRLNRIMLRLESLFLEYIRTCSSQVHTQMQRHFQRRSSEFAQTMIECGEILNTLAIVRFLPYQAMDTYANSSIPLDRQLIPADECERIWNQFQLESERRRLPTQPRIENSSIPREVWIGIAILGWNEFWTILTSPILSFILAWIGIGIFIGVKLGLHRMLIPICKSMLSEWWMKFMARRQASGRFISQMVSMT